MCKCQKHYNVYNCTKCKYCFKMLNVDILITVSRVHLQFCFRFSYVLNCNTYMDIVCVSTIHKVFLFIHVASAEIAI